MREERLSSCLTMVTTQYRLILQLSRFWYITTVSDHDDPPSHSPVFTSLIIVTSPQLLHFTTISFSHFPSYQQGQCRVTDCSPPSRPAPTTGSPALQLSDISVRLSPGCGRCFVKDERLLHCILSGWKDRYLSWVWTTKDNEAKNDKRAFLLTLGGSKEVLF